MKTFDTHEYIKILKAAGIKESQAEAIINAIKVNRDYELSNIVTKEQLVELASRVTSTEENIKNEKTAIKEHIKSEIEAIEEKMRSEIKSSKVNIIKWIIGVMISIATLIVTALSIIY